MTQTDNTVDLEALRGLLDREAVRDAVYRYGSTIDSFDHAGIRDTLSDDVWAQYGNDEPMTGGDTVAAWISSHDGEIVLQHHLLNVYHVSVDGDLADALVYHTSHQITRADLDLAKIIVGRYRMQLRHYPDTWRICRLQMEVLWADQRRDDTAFTQAIGGRGPAEMQPRVPR